MHGSIQKWIGGSSFWASCSSSIATVVTRRLVLVTGDEVEKNNVIAWQTLFERLNFWPLSVLFPAHWHFSS